MSDIRTIPPFRMKGEPPIVETRNRSINSAVLVNECRREDILKISGFIGVRGLAIYYHECGNVYYVSLNPDAKLFEPPFRINLTTGNPDGRFERTVEDWNSGANRFYDLPSVSET